MMMMNPYTKLHIVTTVAIIPGDKWMSVRCLCGWAASGPSWQVTLRRWAHRLANG